MTTFRVSSKVRPGILVSKRGGWIVPAKSGDLILGVWSSRHEAVYLTAAGPQRVAVPSGIQVRGAVSVKAAP